MRGIFVFLIISTVLASSGCVSETGNIAINFTDDEIADQGAAINLSLSGGQDATSHEEHDETETEEEPEHEDMNDTQEELFDETEHDLCADKLCDDSISTCPDGEVVTCENTCDPGTGLCDSCIPDCTEHQLPEEEECNIECGDCEYINKDECECVILLYCDGNGICEPSNDEWPDNPDCVGYHACDDGDACTQDTFNPNQQTCVHTDICCDDSDECTVDYYNYTTDECKHSYVCCGNLECEPENGETEENCPGDCFEEEEESGDVAILDIDYEAEVVTLEGYGILMYNWTIEDLTPKTPNHIYTFPDWFEINSVVYLHTQGNPENNNETDLYWTNKSISIWNNDGDTATLRNDTGEVVDTFTY